MRAETPGSLFEALDPAPRSERDLDAQTEAFLVAWAEDLPRDVPLCLAIHLRQVGGWVAMWQPLQIYLYDWWPLKRREKLLRRMAAMDVELEPGAPSA